MSRLVLQARISVIRSAGWEGIGVGVLVDVKVVEMGRMVIAKVWEGMKGGVGVRICGSGDDEMTGVITGRGIYCLLHAASERTRTVADTILVILFLQSR
jgi:hypothetical protein